MPNNRIEWIDQYRGIAMLLVVLSHTCYVYDGFYVYSMLPMFFFISGYLHKVKYDFRDFVKKIFFRLYIPLVIFGTIPYILQIIKTHSLIPVFNYLIGILTGVGLGWFLPCLIVIEVIVFLLDNMTKSSFINIWFLTLFVCVVSFIGMFFIHERSNVWWSSDTALISIGFYYWGRLYKNISSQKKFSANLCLGIFFVVIFVCISYWLLSLDFYFNISINSISSPIIVYPMCLLSCFVFLPISRIGFWGVFSWMGRNSLLIYCVNIYIHPIASRLLEMFGLCDSYNNLWVGSLNVIIQLLIIYPMSLFINRYCPIVVGVKK